MRSTKKAIKQPNNLRTLVIFFIIVTFLIIVGISVRIVSVVSQSRFDNKHQFTIQLSQSQSSAQLLSIDPPANEVSLLTVSAEKSDIPLERMLGIPTDVTLRTAISINPEEGVAAQFLSLLRDKESWKGRLTFVDIFKIAYVLNLAGTERIETASVIVPMDDLGLSNTIGSLFADELIIEENLTVGVINGAGISGLGKKIERSLMAIGCNVTSVTSSRTSEQRSKVLYFGEPSYTARKLARILNFPLESVEQQGISDIMIVVGRDHASGTIY